MRAASRGALVTLGEGGGVVAPPKLVEFSVTMHHVTRVGLENDGPSEIGIKTAPIPPGALPDVNPTHTWAWAVVQKRPGAEDRNLVGGTADSQTTANAIAYGEFKKLEARWLKNREKPGNGR